MRAEKIQKVNLAFKEMVSAFKNVKNARGDIQIGIITFGGNVEIAQDLVDLDHLTLNEFKAGGKTPMGEAFELVTHMIEDKSVVGPEAFVPIIVLVSDGLPTDLPHEISSKLKQSNKKEDFLKWESLQKMQSSRRVNKAIKLALSIGNDANSEMLKAFINNDSIPLFKAKEISTITKFFEWVTMSVSIRSINPNNDAIFGDERSFNEIFNEDDYEF
jgi:uncharacterized protein YegL